MSEWPSRLQVARWEFQRFVKLKSLVVSFVLMLMMGALGYGVAAWAKRANASPVSVAVIGGEALGLDRPDSAGSVKLFPTPYSQLDSLREAVTRRDLGGILVVTGIDSARLIVRRSPPWKNALEAHLAAARQRRQLGDAGLSADRLASMLAPVRLTTEFHSGKDGRAARIAAMIAVGIVLYGVFTAMAYLLVSVTAEKQLRVTEQIISAISPQTWIDGKILGISAVALVNVVIFIGGGLVWVLGRSIATGAPFSIGSAEPIAIVWIVLFAMLGFMFWLAVFGAIAATIDDPNTSTRGPLMFVPAMFAIAGFLVASNPDSTFARIVGLIPLTSPSVMPARVALTDVAMWEIGLSAALLVAGALLARRAAGKVFSIAMLMYGKEASWSEIRRWIAESR